MDGFDPRAGVILLAATNRPEILDPALLRPGRFDRQVLVDRPDKQGREAILKVHLKKVKAVADLDLTKIATLLGGRAAEQLVLGDISTGAHNDLARATEIARSMVKAYGISSEIGQVYLAADRPQPGFLGPGPETVLYSQTTAEKIDSEIQTIVKQQYDQALAILSQRRDLLEKAVGVLLEKEKIDGEELKALMG